MAAKATTVTELKQRELGRAYVLNQIFMGKNPDLNKLSEIDLQTLTQSNLIKFIRDEDKVAMAYVNRMPKTSLIEMVSKVLMENTYICSGPEAVFETEMARQQLRKCNQMPHMKGIVERGVQAAIDNGLPELRSLREIIDGLYLVDQYAREKMMESLYNMVMTDIILKFVTTGSPSVSVMIASMLKPREYAQYKGQCYAVRDIVVYGHEVDWEKYMFSQAELELRLDSFVSIDSLIEQYMPDHKVSPSMFFKYAKTTLLNNYNVSHPDYISFMICLRAVNFIFGKDRLGGIMNELMIAANCANMLEMQTNESIQNFSDQIFSIAPEFLPTSFKNYCEVRGWRYADQKEFTKRGMICGSMNGDIVILCSDKDISGDGVQDHKRAGNMRYCPIIPAGCFDQICRELEHKDRTKKFGETCKFFEGGKTIPSMPKMIGMTNRMNIYKKVDVDEDE